MFKHGGLNPKFHENHIVFYGTKGAIFIEGHYGMGPLHVWSNNTWKALPLPKAIVDNQPNVKGDTERNWHYLVREFTKDINGEQVAYYQSFKEGSLYQRLIDLIRKNNNWTDVRHLQ